MARTLENLPVECVEAMEALLSTCRGLGEVRKQQTFMAGAVFAGFGAPKQPGSSHEADINTLHAAQKIIGTYNPQGENVSREELSNLSSPSFGKEEQQIQRS